MKFANAIILSFIPVMVVGVMPLGDVQAVTAKDWKAGNIISDSIFTDERAMSVSQIQSWLDKRLKNCDYWGKQKSELGGGKRAQYGKSHGTLLPSLA